MPWPRAREQGVALSSARPSYSGFLPYPLREHCQLLIEYSCAIWPRESLRQGLRLLGRGAAGTMMTSTFGRATVGAATDPVEVVRQMARTFPRVCEPGQVEVLAASEGRAVVGLRGVVFFADCHHVGVYEGALHLARVKGRVKTRGHDATHVDLLCTW